MMELKDALAELSRWEYSTGSSLEEPWTSNHEVRWVDFSRDGSKVIGADYNCPKGGFKAYDALNCMVMDARYGEEYKDVADFLEGMCYTENAKSVRKGLEVWKACCKMLADFKASGVDVWRMMEAFGVIEENGAESEAEKAIKPCEGEYD